jgi:hypothetical protein
MTTERGTTGPLTAELRAGMALASALMAANYGGDSGEDVDRLIAELAKRGYRLCSDADDDETLRAVAEARADAERAARAPEGDNPARLAEIAASAEYIEEKAKDESVVALARRIQRLVEGAEPLRAARAEPGLDVERLVRALAFAGPLGRWLPNGRMDNPSDIDIARDIAAKYAALEAHGEPQEGKRWTVTCPSCGESYDKSDDSRHECAPQPPEVGR